MEPLNITITDLSLNTVVGQSYDTDKEYPVPVTLADAIVEAAARLLSQESDWVSVKTQVRSIRTEVIRERVAAEVEAALSGPINTTNGWGEQVGPPTTLRAEIAKMAAEALKVDHRNIHSREFTPAQKVIREQVDQAMTKELAEAVADEKAKVVAAVRAKAADLIAEAVRQGVGR